MAFIDKLEVCNFKAFYGTETINFEGKHLLMYGENGSGKSSIYWAIYTLFQAIIKKPSEIQKYFDPYQEENLVNRFYLEENSRKNEQGKVIYLNPEADEFESYVKIFLNNKNSFKISYKGLENLSNGPDIALLDIEKLNKYSDFINHRVLSNFYNFKNSEEINLWELFVRNIFPSLTVDQGKSDYTIAREYKHLLVSKAPYSFPENSEKFQLKSKLPNNFISRIKRLNDAVDYWLGEINTKVNDFYAKNFTSQEDPEFRISLAYEKKLEFKNKLLQYFENKSREYNYIGFNKPQISLKIEIKLKDSNEYIEISRPQSFINEARLTGIALAIRFTLLLDFIRPDAEDKHLILDDLLLSLDMSNRSKVLDIILGEFSSKYKIFLFTHSLEFFRFCDYKIKQKTNKNDWTIKEIHTDAEEFTPVIIDSQLDYLSQAKKYHKAKDYIASSVFLRKEMERFIKERIPEEFIKDKEYHTLNHLWELLIEKYRELGHKIDENITKGFEQSRLMVLNPSAHDNLSQRIYKVELQSAFEFREELDKVFPLYDRTIVLKEETILEFRHPTEDYIFEFKLLKDLSLDKLEEKTEPNNPKCSVIYWRFGRQDFYDFVDKQALSSRKQENAKSRKDRILKVIDNLSKIKDFDIDDEMFYAHTFLKGSNLSLKVVLDSFEFSKNM